MIDRSIELNLGRPETILYSLGRLTQYLEGPPSKIEDLSTEDQENDHLRRCIKTYRALVMERLEQLNPELLAELRLSVFETRSNGQVS